MRRVERALFATLVRAYPPEFRAEFGDEMARDFALLRRQAQADGVTGAALLWLMLLADTVRSAPRQRWETWRERRSHTNPADNAGAAVAGVAVFLLYFSTLAPTTAFWDAGEYQTVAHVVGIPHPPGNPLFVLVARTWSLLLSFTGLSVAVRINLLSAACSAVAHLFLFLALDRALRGALPARTHRRIAAACAVLLSATAFTVWHQSNVNEKVYTLSFLGTMLTVWLALRWRDTRRLRVLLLALYLTALTATNHLMGVLVAPALLVFIARVDYRVLFDRRLWLAATPAVVIALSAQLFLPIRAAQRPLVNESDPTCESLVSAAASVYTQGALGCRALSATLRREQYAKPSVLSDPNAPEQPRGARLLASQFVNYVQYLDWQWSRSVAGHAPLFGGVRPLITLLVLALALLGARTHWRADRDAAWLHGVLLLTFSVGLVLYLNFRWGYTIARDLYPEQELHEVRERDYFYLIGFSLWGAWIGLGLATVWRACAQRLAARSPRARWAAAPVLACAFLPLLLNWSWASRADDWTARDWAWNILMSVEPYGVLVTNGDNDSFPLWYLQHVERVREDVTIVLAPYLATSWYARQVRDGSRPCTDGVVADADPTRITCQRPFDHTAIHPLLLQAWGGREPPKDSVLPYSDVELDRMAQSWFVPQQPLALNVGTLSATIAPGLPITPIDTFVAAIVQSSFGQRPIHFTTPSAVVARLGLRDHTVRVGLTWKLDDAQARAGLVKMPEGRDTFGAYVDLTTTDTLARNVFVVRGRVTDPDRPWVDHATYSVPLQYALMHYALAVAHRAVGDTAGVERSLVQLDFWNRHLGD